MGEIEYVLEAEYTKPMLDSVVKARGGRPGGTPTAADSAGVREAIQTMTNAMMAPPPGTVNGVRPGPSQCHDITVYPAIGLAGGACGGDRPLLGIRRRARPPRGGARCPPELSFSHSRPLHHRGGNLPLSPAQ